MWSTPLLAVAALALGPVNALWPVPQKISTGEKVLFIDQTLEVTYNGESVRWIPPGATGGHDAVMQDTETLFNNQISYTYGYSPSSGSDFSSKEIVQAGVSRAFQAIFQDNFVPWKLRARNSDFEPDVYETKTFVKSIQITQTEKDDDSAFKPLAGEVDESYSLTLSENGKAVITAKSSVGCLHALESFLQLFFKHSSGTFWYTPHAPVSIEDKPEFPHRGVLLDVARSWFEVDDIKHTIDAMAWNKMNRLHLHITDSQSWPLEIPALPKLAEEGAYRKGLSYSPEDLKGIYEYGVHRGVEVVIEIDMPGHIGVVELAYKDLIVAYNEKPYQWWCAEPPCGAFRMNSTAVYDFLDKLFEDLLPRISPYTAYFHTGGDELNKNDSMLDPDILSNDTEVLTPLLQTFLDYAHGKVRDAGLTPLVWEEMVTTWNMTLGDDVVIQSWLGGSAVKDLAEAGHKVIDSDYNFWVSTLVSFPDESAMLMKYDSTLIVAVVSGSTLTTAKLSKPFTPLTIGVAPLRAGVSSIPTTLPPGCPRRRRSGCSAARWRSGPRPSTPSTWTRWCGREQVRLVRCSGLDEQTRAARTGLSTMPRRGWRRCASAWLREACALRRCRCRSALRAMQGSAPIPFLKGRASSRQLLISLHHVHTYIPAFSRSLILRQMNQ